VLPDRIDRRTVAGHEPVGELAGIRQELTGVERQM
jgi:hypothetical protein